VAREVAGWVLPTQSAPQPAAELGQAVSGFLIVTDQNGLLETLERLFEVRFVCSKCNQANLSIEVRSFFDSAQYVSKLRLKACLVGIIVSNPFSSDKIRWWRGWACKHELHRLAKNARNANLKEDVRQGPGRSEIREYRESKATSSDQVDNFLEIVTGSGNSRCRHGLNVFVPVATLQPIP